MSRLVVLTDWGVLDVLPHDPTGAVLAPPTHVIVAEHQADTGPKIVGQGRSVPALTRDAQRFVSTYGWRSAVVLPIQSADDTPRANADSRSAARVLAWGALLTHYAPIYELAGDGEHGATRWLLVQRNADGRHAFVTCNDVAQLRRTAAAEALDGWTPIVLIDLDTGTQQDVVVSLPAVRFTAGSTRPNPLGPR